MADLKFQEAADAGALVGTEIIPLATPQGTSPETYVDERTTAQDAANLALPVQSVSKTANFTLALSDAYKIVYVSITSSPLADITCTVPTNATVAFAVGTVINIVLEDDGGASPANKVVVTGATGVTVNGVSEGTVNLAGNYGAVSLHKKATNTWTVVGAIS